ncbi:HAD family hydrolase [Szabonella alba]|uniref:phosphoglycolate phosphatase n=1 Tax=Szabonella alba TaxID=2804194 RepID=A0A8K0XZT4_9RHOB|nr:HAD family hydrolase [Szabonella alba]MBL4916383.1 HAD family hydrolase [Szabonella alba]
MDGVIFDKDGTLFDFRRSWGGWASGMIDSLTDGDTELAARLARAIGYDRDRQDFHPDSPVIAATAEEIATALLPELPGIGREDLRARINAMAATATMAEAVPLRATLSALRAKGLALGLATNDSEGPARAHLAAHDIADLFDFIAGYDSGHGAKPGPGMCLAFLRATGTDPSRVVMVGDSRHDLMAGRAAGMLTVAVLTGIADAAELAPHADAVLPDIGGLGQWIDAQRAL